MTDKNRGQAVAGASRTFLVARRYQTEIAIKSLRETIADAPEDAREDLMTLLETLEERLSSTIDALDDLQAQPRRSAANRNDQTG